MDIFKLPQTTIVNKVIPKNSFDTYTTAKQKKLFTDLVQRITWTHKLSTETTNLPGKDIKEIQIFKIELKAQESIDSILLAIDKAIPYPIIFVVIFDEQMYLSTCVKHPHPVNEDNAVIDWSVKTEWQHIVNNMISISLKKSIDAIYLNACLQISGEPVTESKSLREFVERSKSLDLLSKEVIKLKGAIANCKQYNQKVELNIYLNSLESELKTLLSK